jgi:hypothetical protein
VDGFGAVVNADGDIVVGFRFSYFGLELLGFWLNGRCCSDCYWQFYLQDYACFYGFAEYKIDFFVVAAEV